MIAARDRTGVESMPELTSRNTICESAAIALLAVCCWLAAPLGARAASPDPISQSKLASYDWSVKASPNLAVKPPPEELVESFLNAVDVSLGGEGGFGDDEYICSFSFADMRHNGYLSLIAGLGSTGRAICHELYVIDKTSSGFDTYLAGGDSTAGEDVSGKIKDLHHDGKLEFLLASAFGEIQNQCCGNWTSIYAWTGGGYTNVSDNFKDFYRQQLDSLNKKISALNENVFTGYRPVILRAIRAGRLHKNFTTVGGSKIASRASGPGMPTLRFHPPEPAICSPTLKWS